MLPHLALPAFNDNYIWLLRDSDTRQCAVVDPGDPAPVQQWLAANPDWTLTDILITHHHADHTGGIASLKQSTGAKVSGPALDKVEGLDVLLNEGDQLEVAGFALRVLHVPGHTLGHIAYVHEGEQPFVFSGDTLFAGGCGRIFEGTPQQMYDSLQKLAALPANTQLYCTHEYTQSNLGFALAVEPDNQALQQRMQEVVQLREQDLITLPSSLEIELATNPFLRCNEPSVQQSLRDQRGLEGNAAVEAFASLRGWKDVF